jgi:hypothetical protein
MHDAFEGGSERETVIDNITVLAKAFSNSQA